MIILNVTFYTVQKNRLKTELDSRGKSLATLFAANVRLGVFTNSIDLLQVPISSLIRQPDIVSVCIYNKEYQPLLMRENSNLHGGSEQETCRLLEHKRTGTRGNIFNANTTVFYQEPVFITHSSSPNDDLYFNIVGDGKSEQIGFVVLNLSKGQLLEDRKDLILQTLGIGISFVVIILLLTFLIVNETTRPLRELLNRIKNQMTVPETGGSDIALLDDTLTSLLKELEDSFLAINTLKNNLEIEVGKRTDELLCSNKNLTTTLRDLQETQMQLIHSEKMASLGLLSTGLAHEINNALTIIKGSLMPLQEVTKTLHLDDSDKKQGESAKKEALHTFDTLIKHMDIGVERISHLIQDLMVFSRQDAGTKKLIDINKELDICLELLKIEDHKTIRFTKRYGVLRPVLCDGGQTGQVFFNILLNAIQAIEDKGEIRITTQAIEENIVIVMEDNGCGIHSEVLPKVFDPFFTTKEVGQGTGLGLGICHSIVKAHRGDIVITSEVNRGTTITVTLPIFNESKGILPLNPVQQN